MPLGQFYAKSGDVTVSRKSSPACSKPRWIADPQDVATAHRLAELLVEIQNAEDESQWKVIKPGDQSLEIRGRRDAVAIGRRLDTRQRREPRSGRLPGGNQRAITTH